MLEGLFLAFVVVIGFAFFMAREWGKSASDSDHAEDTIEALHKSIDEAQEADEIRRKTAADTLAGRVSSKYYRD